VEHLPASELTPLGQVSRLATHLGALPPESVRDLTLYADGDANFDALVEAIGRAKRHVHAEYYIFRADQTGTRIRDALIERAKAGVTVRLLLDAVGARARSGDSWPRCGRRAARSPTSTRSSSGAPGAPTPSALTARSWWWTASGLHGRRQHLRRPLARVNGPLAWRDTNLRIEGAAVHGLQRTFFENWHFAAGAWDKLHFHSEAVADWFPPAQPGERAAQIIASGPDSDTRAIVAFYFAAINGARERVWLTTPYFVPEEQILYALCSAALRGVDVQLVLPARTDARLVDAAGATFHDQLLQAGVRIHIYGPR